MNTVYDWLTVGIFAGLIVLFLQRSSLPDPSDHLHHYLVAALGCAGANYLGNQEWHLPAIGLLAITLAFIFYALRPFRPGGSS